MYIQHSTANPLGHRPWQSRLTGYTRSKFLIPTQSPGQSISCHNCPASGLACGGCPQMAGLAASFPNIAYARHPRLWLKREGADAPVPTIIRPPELGAITYGVRIPRQRRPAPVRTAAATIAARDFRRAAPPGRRMIYLPRPPITEKRAPATVAVAPAPATAQERRAQFWALRRPTGQILPDVYRPAPSPAPRVAVPIPRRGFTAVTPAYQLASDGQPSDLMENVKAWMGQESLIGGIKNWWFVAGAAAFLWLRAKRGGF